MPSILALNVDGRILVLRVDVTPPVGSGIGFMQIGSTFQVAASPPGLSGIGNMQIGSTFQIA
jgi:hypothetical protein